MDGRIKTPKVERVLLHQHHRSREYVTGTLCLTDRHLIFIEPTGTKETWVLYHHILSCDRQALTTRGYPLIIDTKTFQRLCLIIPRETDCINVMDTITSFAQPEKHEDLYAFQYRPNIDGFSQSRGWNVYDPLMEFGRMGVAEDKWKTTNLNANYELCQTYSSALCVPNVDDGIITGSAKFRSKGRLPVLSYYCQAKNSALCRCSQPLSYITRRSVEDEAMIQGIVDANPHSSFIYVVDTRPKLNAVVNKAAHKGGYESTENYTNVKYQFMDIHNIHVMRESLQKITEAVHSSNGVSGFLSALESSSWLKHIHLILEASAFIAKALFNEGVSVLVHCSDGWDRTAQTCATASLLMDPYYRTIHGFIILIEKEWLSFGHKFTIRSGHLQSDLKETSPIFTQFLDATWQVMVQFPTSFQFNELFLITLHDHLYSSQFGTFLGNNERERKTKRFSELTYSLWGQVWARLEDFMNPLFGTDNQQVFLNISTEVPSLSFWRGLYCRHESGPHPQELWQEVATSINQQNKCLADHIKYLKQHKQDLKRRLSKYQSSSDSAHSTSPNTPDPVTQVGGAIHKPHPPQDQSIVTNGSQALERVRADSSETCSLETPPDNNSTSKNTKPLNNTVEKIGTVADNRPQDFHKPTIQKLSLTVSLAKTDTQQQDVLVNQDKSIGIKRIGSPELQSLLLHIPEMNLPWYQLRQVSKCSCGVVFSFTERKFHCSYCGTVMCAVCGINHAPLPFMAMPSAHRVCKPCFKLMSSRQEDQLRDDGGNPVKL